MIFAIMLFLLVVGSVLFHLYSPWYLTPLASNWGTMDDTIDLTFWVTGAVFVAINVFMAYCVFRFRNRPGQKADYEPENKKLEIWLTGLTTLGVAAMLGPGLFVWADFVNVPEEAAQVEAVGQQWHWTYRFPGEDGKLGAVEARHVSVANPLGLVPEDPDGQDDVIVDNPELHIPVGKPVKMLLRSMDVLHNFTVTQIRVKMDLVPGIVSYIWFTPTKTGEFDVMCEEYCGLAHFAMRGRIVFDEVPDFEKWLAKQPTFAELAARPAGDAVAGKPLYAVCAACHGTEGEGNLALNAPKLAGQQGWYMERQLQAFKHGKRGADADDVFGQQMVPMMATLVDDVAIRNVVAHIETLPDHPAPKTLSGDVARGEKLYRTCAACHGADGRGSHLTNAPRQTGMNDWYLARQLQNFRSGIRGAHRDDIFGAQMGMMSANLRDQTITDLVAYINELE
jgi:cytochrome c oxidase subunit 2